MSLKGQYGSNSFVLDFYFIKVWNRIFLIESKDNIGQTTLSFDQNLFGRLENAMLIKKIIEKKLKIILRTIWVKLYWLWFSFFNTFEIKLIWAFDETSFKNFMDNMSQIVLLVLPFDQNLLETIAKFTMGWIICEFDKD